MLALARTHTLPVFTVSRSFTVLANGNGTLYSSAVVLICDQSGQGPRQAYVNVQALYAGYFVFLSNKHPTACPYFHLGHVCLLSAVAC